MQGVQTKVVRKSNQRTQFASSQKNGRVTSIKILKTTIAATRCCVGVALIFKATGDGGGKYKKDRRSPMLPQVTNRESASHYSATPASPVDQQLLSQIGIESGNI
jgi:hypothetical protein